MKGLTNTYMIQTPFFGGGAKMGYTIRTYGCLCIFIECMHIFNINTFQGIFEEEMLIRIQLILSMREYVNSFISTGFFSLQMGVSYILCSVKRC